MKLDNFSLNYFLLFSGNTFLPNYIINLDNENASEDMENFAEIFGLEDFECLTEFLPSQTKFISKNSEMILDQIIERLYVDLDIFAMYDFTSFLK